MPSQRFKPGTPKPKNSGRKKGTPNKRSAELVAAVEEICARVGVQPIESMAIILRDSRDEALRFQAAKELAGYMYAKRRHVELTSPAGAPVNVNVGDQTGLVELFKNVFPKYIKEPA